MPNIATITNNVISALSGTTSQVLLGDATLTDFKLDSLTDVNVPTPGDGDVLRWNATTSLWEASDAAGITGSGTTNYIPKFTPNGGTLGNSQIFDNGSNVIIGSNTAPSTTWTGIGRLAVVSNVYVGVNLTTANETNGNYTILALGKSKGTLSAPTATPDNETLSSIVFYGHDGTNYLGTSNITVRVTGTVTTSSVPTSMLFATGNGTEKMRLTSSGNLLIGSTSDTTEKLQVTGDLKVTGISTFLNNLNVINENGYIYTSGRLYITGEKLISAYFSNSLNAGYSTANQYGWINGAGSLRLGTNGSARLSITDTGNVGIGTTAPDDRLSVIGGIIKAGTTTVQMAFLGADGSNVAYVGSLTNHPFQIRVNNTTRMSITTAGSVGIGTTSPAYLLDVQGTIGATSGVFSSVVNIAGASSVESLNVAGNIMLQGTANRYLRLQSATNYFYNLQSVNDDFHIVEAGTTPRLVIKYPSGNIGIGTTNPNPYSWASKTLTVSSSVANSYAALEAYGNGTGAGALLLGNNTVLRASIVGIDGSHLAFATNGNNTGSSQFERMRITAEGNVGIGTTTPAYKLDVNGIIRSYTGTGTGRIELGTGDTYTGIIDYSAVNGLWYLNNRTAAASSSTDYFQFQADGVAILTMKKSGAATFSSTISAVSNFSTYVTDGVFGATATPSVINLPNSNNRIIFGYATSGDGIYHGRIGVLSNGVGRVSFGAAANSTFTIGTGDTEVERLRIDSSGSVLIGTTQKLGLDTNTNKLQVIGGITVGNGLSTYVYATLQYSTSDFVITGNAHPANVGDNSIIFRTGSSGGGGPIEHMRIISSGHVGIGTTTADPFVRGYTRMLGISTTTASGSTAIQLNGGSGGYGQIDFGAGGVRTAGISGSANETQWGSLTAIPAIIFTNSAERLRISSDGNVAIGTTAATYKLNVVSLTEGLFVQGANSSPFNQKIAEFKYGGNGNSLYIQNVGGQPGFSTSSGTNFNISPASGNTIIHSGSLGIGTAAPQGILDITGGSGATGVASYFSTSTGYSTPNAGNAAIPGGAKIVLWNNTSGQRAYIGMDANADIWFNNAGFQGNAGFTFYTGDGLSASPQVRLKITKSGLVGINQASPTFLLDVNGDASINGVRIGKGPNSLTGNTVLGASALNGVTTGTNNVAIGSNALDGTTTGSNNIAIGFSAGGIGVAENTTGSQNIFIGAEAQGEAATDSNRTWIGGPTTLSTWLAGNLLLGTKTNSTYRLDVVGTTRLSSTLLVGGATTLTNLAGTGTRIVVADTNGILSTQPTSTYLSSLSGEATNDGSVVTLTNSAVIGKVLTGLNVSSAIITASDSILTAFGKIQGQIDALQGGTVYKGSWNASTNTPTITSSVGTQGNYYVVTTAGTTNINGISSWSVGDWIIFNGTVWEKIPNSNDITSVNGQTGVVVLTTSNINEGTNLYYTDTRARDAISLTVSGNSGAATYTPSTGVFNIPTYTLGGLGGVATGTTITINGVAQDLSTNRTYNVGTITSIVAGSYLTGGTITSSGTIAVDATTTNTANKIVARDASGNFSAGTITATLSGISTNAYSLYYEDGPRDLSNRLPNSFTRTVLYDFVTSGVVGGTGAYAGVMTYVPWTGTTASTGDSSYQLAFMNLTGSNGTGLPGLRIRKGIDSTWGTWYTLLHAGNYNSYAPSLTGTGASGDWGINITGNAVTVGGLSVHSARNNEANKVVRTDGSGYIQAGWINTLSGDNGTTAIDRIYASSDAYIRYYTPANFRQVLDVPTRTGSGASGNWGINITGNAASASTSSQVTINYNNNSDAFYQMLWGSGNSVYGTAGVTCNPFTDSISISGTLFSGGITVNGFGRMYGGDFWHSGTANNGTRTTTFRLGRFVDSEIPAYTIYTDDTNGDILEFYSERYTGDVRLTRNSETGIRNMVRLASDNAGSFIDLYDGGGSSVNSRITTNGNSYLMGGNVGIGINTPAYKLDVSGDVRISGELIMSDTDIVVTEADQAARFSKTYSSASNLTNLNLYSTVSNVLFNLTSAAYNGDESFNATSLLSQTTIVGNSGSVSTQPMRAIMAGIVGQSGSAAMNIADFRYLDIKQPDRAGITGHVIQNIYGLKVADMKNSTGYTITNSWAIYQEGANDNNYFNGKVVLGSNSVGVSKLRLVGLPTSSAGLSSGDVWNSGGTLRIV